MALGTRVVLDGLPHQCDPAASVDSPRIVESSAQQYGIATYMVITTLICQLSGNSQRANFLLAGAGNQCPAVTAHHTPDNFHCLPRCLCARTDTFAGAETGRSGLSHSGESACHIICVSPQRCFTFLTPTRHLRRPSIGRDGIFAPLAVFILHGYIGQLPRELEEAAYLDGAALRGILTEVVLPAISTGVTATAVIIFVLSWNQFFLPLVLTLTKVRVVPVMMRDFFALEREFDWTVASAVSLVSLIPVSLMVALAHRQLERFSFLSLLDRD
jgi:hypothetical protein